MLSCAAGSGCAGLEWAACGSNCPSREACKVNCTLQSEGLLRPCWYRQLKGATHNKALHTARQEQRKMWLQTLQKHTSDIELANEAKKQIEESEDNYVSCVIPTFA